MDHPRELLPDEPSRSERRTRLIIEFWSSLDNEGETGATTWEALDRLRERVTTALLKRPPDLGLAESVTARAALLMAGYRES